MAGDEAGEIGGTPYVQGGNRHKDRTKKIEDDAFGTRLEQAVDWFAMGNDIPKEQAATKAIDLINKIRIKIS